MDLQRGLAPGKGIARRWLGRTQRQQEGWMVCGPACSQVGGVRCTEEDSRAWEGERHSGRRMGRVGEFASHWGPEELSRTQGLAGQTDLRWGLAAGKGMARR